MTKKKNRELELLKRIGTFVFNTSLITIFVVPWLTSWSVSLKLLFTAIYGLFFGLLFQEASKGDKK